MSHHFGSFRGSTCKERRQRHGGQAPGPDKWTEITVGYHEQGVELGIVAAGRWVNIEPDAAEALAHTLLVAARAARRHAR